MIYNLRKRMYWMTLRMRNWIKMSKKMNMERKKKIIIRMNRCWMMESKNMFMIIKCITKACKDKDLEETELAVA